MKKGLKIGFVYAGTVIGAGFASGRELWQFFGRFGSLGILGLGVCFLLYFILGYFAFTIIGKSKAEKTYELYGRRGRPIMQLNLIFMFVLFVAMTAAAGAMSEEIIGLRHETGSLVFCLFIWFCIYKGSKGFSEVSSVLTPLLLLLGAVCGTAVCPFWKMQQIEPEGTGFLPVLFSALLYVSYNALPLGAVMFPFREDLSKKSVRFWGSFWGSLIMFILGVCLFQTIVLYYDLAKEAALPVLIIIKEVKGGLLYGVYGGVLFAAVLTTAAGNFFGFAESLCRGKKGNSLKVVMLILGYMASLVGFSGIISIIYPIFGILGLLNILFIVYNMYKGGF